MQLGWRVLQAETLGLGPNDMPPAAPGTPVRAPSKTDAPEADGSTYGNDFDLAKATAIACDQYALVTQYCDRVEAAVGDAPMMLRPTYPELQLAQGRDSEIIDVVLEERAERREGGVVTPHEPGLVLVDQKAPSAEIRLGLKVAFDLVL